MKNTTKRPTAYSWKERILEQEFFLIFREEGLTKKGPRGEFYIRTDSNTIKTYLIESIELGYAIFSSEPQK